ncbi:MAG: type II toxin-antitoxin system VapC family toxin [Acidimicrobiales bacterium]|nr:type II toxin-antitoxin system VapC family toxin [Acidimicrobiales bacterium]
MTLAIDPSALIARYVPGPDRALVNTTMAAEDTWCASDLARTELMLALHRIAGAEVLSNDLRAAARADLDAFVTVPVDDRCIARATELGSQFGLRTVDAIHLAAADRLPRPVRYLTLDRHQIPAASALGFDLVAPLAR